MEDKKVDCICNKDNKLKKLKKNIIKLAEDLSLSKKKIKSLEKRVIYLEKVIKSENMFRK